MILDVSKVFKTKEEAGRIAISRGEDSITDFRKSEFPTSADLAKEYGLEKEYSEARKKKVSDRK